MKTETKKLLPPGLSAAVAVLAFASVSCAPVEETNVLVISIDTLRADRLGCYGYIRDTSPEIDAFAQDAVLFENAFTPMSVTLPAHLAMLTSTHPETNQIRGNSQSFSADSGINTIVQTLQTRG